MKWSLGGGSLIRWVVQEGFSEEVAFDLFIQMSKRNEPCDPLGQGHSRQREEQVQSWMDCERILVAGLSNVRGQRA